jgi:taurine dioxygenase
VPTLPDHPEIRRQEQPSEMGIEANIVWHSDDIFLEVPSKGSLLWALEVPEKGGDTVWCDMELAYEGLSDTMKRIVAGLRALHVPMANMHELVNMFGADAFARMHKKSTPVEHPVVRTHPETGRPSLFVSELNTTQIVGMTRKESDNLLQFLFKHSQQPDYQCRFSWRKGSAAFWDNRCTMHRGLPNFTQGHRLMHRVAIADSEPPIYAPTD